MEGEEITLRQMLREHIKESADFRKEIIPVLAKIEVHGEYTKKQLTDHETRIQKLHDARNRQKGALWAATLLGFTALIDMIKRALA